MNKIERPKKSINIEKLYKQIENIMFQHDLGVYEQGAVVSGLFDMMAKRGLISEKRANEIEAEISTTFNGNGFNGSDPNIDKIEKSIAALVPKFFESGITQIAQEAFLIGLLEEMVVRHTDPVEEESLAEDVEYILDSPNFK